MGFRQDLMMMKDRQTNLDGEIETLEYDLEEMRQDGNGEQWHALKDSNEEQWYDWVGEEIEYLKSEVERINAGLRNQMPLFQSELESFQKRLDEIADGTWNSCQQMDKGLRTAEQKLRCLKEEFRGLSWLNESTDQSGTKK